MSQLRIDALAGAALKQGWTVTCGNDVLVVRCSVVHPVVIAKITDIRAERYLPSQFRVQAVVDGQGLPEQKVHSVQTVIEYLSSLTIEKRKK